MTRTPARACQRKMRHETRDDARDHLERLIRNGASRARLEIYQCKHCGAYHVGHKLGSNGRRR